MPDESPTIAYRRERVSAEDMIARAHSFSDEMRTRRSVREFSSDEIPQDVLELAVATAATAPSGANMTAR
ncbi:MAG TPA: nitroreductase family protein [Thermoanaerobaculia bacterium]